MTSILSIVIVNWNTCDLLADCLQSIHEDLHDFHCGDVETGEVETIVVDNASTDQSVQTLREQFPWVQLICNAENVGFAAANNQAIQVSQGRYVLLLNPDTRLISGALMSLIDFMNTNPHAGIAGARLLNPDGSTQPSCSKSPTLRRELWRLFHLDAILPYSTYSREYMSSEQPLVVDVVQGAALITRRAVLNQVGLLDTDYYIYSEEVDFCYRVQKAGWRIYWLSGSKVIHYGGQSTQQVRAEMFLQLYLAKVLYFRKNHSVVVARLYKLILLIAALSRILLGPLGWLLNSSRRIQYLQLVGYYRRLLSELSSF